MLSAPEITLGWKFPRRKKLIDDLADKGEYDHQIKFQNRLQRFSVYTIPIDFAKYRLANGRTQASQEEYIAKHPDLPEHFFSRDQESDQAQAVQHKILESMLGTQDKDLLNYFRKNEQDQPIILTHDGIVVNGNRRLCAMRIIYYDDPDKYSNFSHLEVIFLPPCDEQDIDELEAHLQLEQDIKQEYTWISKACMFRARQEKHGYTYKQLATIYEMKPGDVSQSLGLLECVDEYLADRDNHKQYKLVEQDEYAFKQLIKSRKKIKDNLSKEYFTQISYTLIDGAEIEGRLYQVIPDIEKYLYKIVEELEEQLPLESEEEIIDEDYAVFGIEGTENVSLVNSVTDPENKDQVVEIVQDVIQSEKIKEIQKKKKLSVLDEVTKANTSMQNAVNNINEKSDKTGIKEQLESINLSIKKIVDWL